MRGFEKFPVGKRKAQTLNFDGQIEECFSLDESLSPAFCLKEQAAAENVSALFPSLFYGGYAFAEGKLYALTESGLLLQGEFSSPPVYAAGFYGGDEADLFGDGTSLFTVGGDGLIKLADVAGIPLCTHRFSLVLKDGRSLKVSAPFAPEDFSVAHGAWEWRIGSSAGEIAGAAEIDGRLYVFCERGVYACTQNGYDREAEVKFTPAGDILASSFASWGKTAYFLTGAGRLYSFGGAANCVAENVEFTPSALKACAFSQGYALTLSAEKTLVYDAEKKRVSYLKVNAAALGGAAAYADGKILRFARSSGGGSLLSKPLDFGTCAPKKLSRVSFTGEGKIALKISAEREEKSFSVAAGESVYPKMSGRKFVFLLNADDGAKIKKITVSYTVTGEV